MDIKQIIGLISGLVVFSAFVPYITSTIKNESRPHPVTWTLWTIITSVSLFLYWNVGARETLWLAFFSLIGQSFVAIFSIKYWDVGFTRFDRYCLGVSIVSIFIWIVSGDAPTALSFSIIADFLAVLPTIQNIWFNPMDERLLTWVILSVGNVLSLFSVREWSYGVALLPVYLVVLSVSLSALIILRRSFVS